MATSNTKSNILQVIEAAENITSVTGQVVVSTGDITSLTGQAILATTGTTTAEAITKLLVLAAPDTTTTKSNILQIIEATDPTPTVTSVTGQIVVTDSSEVTLVTAQTILAPIGVTSAKAVNKTFILQQVTSVQVSNVKLEVIGQSTITPPVPGTRVIWFNS